MHRTLGLIALAAVSTLPAYAGAQPYPGVTPVPRTTDPGKLRSYASAREASERIKLAFAEESRSDWGPAGAELERVIALHLGEPQGSTAYYDLGIAQAQLQQFDAAVISFGKAIDLDPGFLAARTNLVTVQLLRGDLAAARKSADAFVALAPDSARGLYQRGIVALRTGDAATALSDFERLLGSNPGYALGHYDLAIAEIKSGQLAEAERELRTAIGLAPSYARARLALGAVLLRQNRRAEAKTAFDAAARVAQDVALRELAASLRDAIKD